MAKNSIAGISILLIVSLAFGLALAEKRWLRHPAIRPDAGVLQEKKGGIFRRTTLARKKSYS